MFFQEYREPFAGGAGIFFDVDPGLPRWINDRNQDLISLYVAVRDRVDDLLDACDAVPPVLAEEADDPDGESMRKSRLARAFQAIRQVDDIDPAFKYLFLNRTSFSGKVHANRASFSNENGWNDRLWDRLRHASTILQGTRITCGDFEAVITAPGDQVWIYLDPPYLSETRRSPGSKLYAGDFTMEDQERLAEAVDHCPHKILLSYDDDPWVRDRYQDYEISEASWTYSVSSGRIRGRELVITN